MKKILTVYTGGTIGCAPSDGQRKLNTELAKRYIALRFSQSDSQYACLGNSLFEDSCLTTQTLSENMTVGKLQGIVDHLRSFDLSRYAGVMIMHGTDTLAYTAALLSMLFCDTPVPIMLISGAKPPMVEGTNANTNFRAGVELIMSGIAPNVYVPYCNTDGTLHLHLCSRIMQSANFSDDFYSIGDKLELPVTPGLLDICAAVSQARGKSPFPQAFSLQNSLLCLHPYTGLDYGRISLDGVKAVLHGTYHSGTFCLQRNTEAESYTSDSVLYLADRCKERSIPLFAAPCTLGDGQYSSVFDGVHNGGIVPLSMTFECAWAKALLGTSNGLCGDKLVDFMTDTLNSEML